jgi:two-component system phosphate regulon sensor histidine kinase PhoR
MVREPGKYFADIETSTQASEYKSEVSFRPAPGNATIEDGKRVPVWRVRFDMVSDPAKRFGLDINGEVIFGRSKRSPEFIDLTAFGAGRLGVSRRHLMLRPTPSHLFAIDVGSTNGTYRNGRSIGFRTPSRLVNGDTLTLGRLELRVNIIERPSFQTSMLGGEPTPDLAEALSQIAKAITSQLDLNQVLNQVTETAMVLTAAGETSIWLVDENSGNLYVKAQRGIQDEKIQDMRLPIAVDTLAGQVIVSGKPLHAHRQPGEDQIKVKTHYLVEALLYVPIILGGVTLGVVSAVHRQGGKHFDKRDERLLTAIADFAAIAIQNARLYQATDEALQHRVNELSALNQVSRAVSASLDLDEVYKVLVAQVNMHWPVEAVRLYLLDEQEQSLYLHTGATDSNGTEPHELGKGIIGQTAAKGEAIFANEARSHPHYLREVDGIDGHDTISVACVPLHIQERVVGVLALLNKKDGPFTEADVSRLVAFANPVATAIENANLFKESERQRAAIMATAQTLSQPLLILDENGRVLVSNESANEILEKNMAQLFEGISHAAGRTTEILIGEQTYLASAQHLADVGTIIVMQDITYVKQLEKDRADFMHALSHDLKSPLTSIMGWAQLLEKVVSLDERGVSYVDKLVASAERMLDLINQMLQTVARGDTVDISEKACDMEHVVATVMSDAEGAALHKSIHMDFQMTGEPYHILADETRLYHMLLNLVDNAIKYSPEDTTINVRLDFRNDEIAVRVQDEGQGIPEQDLPRLFDKYYRGTEAKIQPGAGLGLSVVWAIADAHGGRVSVSNRPEGGAEFKVVLPGTLRVSSETAAD